MKIIARIESDFKEKFGIPRQSGLVPQLTARIVFEPEYRNPDALRGVEGFSHLWLIWEFSQARRETWSPTVRPPRLGGNTRMGVFATRSPFRPNPIGLSCVQLLRVEWDTPQGPVLVVGGADSHPDACGGFGAEKADYHLQVVFPEELEEMIPPDKREALRGVLAGDPRPSYQEDPERVYGVAFAGRNITFTVSGGVLTVNGVQ